jgi:hypothetical protein
LQVIPERTNFIQNFEDDSLDKLRGRHQNYKSTSLHTCIQLFIGNQMQVPIRTHNYVYKIHWGHMDIKSKNKK